MEAGLYMEIMEYAELFSPLFLGEYIVGPFYGMYTDGGNKCRISFLDSFAGQEAQPSCSTCAMLPDHFAFQYDMRSGNEFARRALGVSYRTEPKSAENSRFWQPDYIRYYLIRTNDKTKI